MPSIYDLFGNAEGLQGLLSDAQIDSAKGNALTNFGLALMQASGPSTMPSSFGQNLAAAYSKGREAFKSGIEGQVSNVLTAQKIAELKRATTNRAGQLAALKAATGADGTIDYNKLVTGSLPFASDPLSTALEGARLRKEAAEASRIEKAMTGNFDNPFEALTLDESLEPSTRKLATYYRNRFATMKPEDVDKAMTKLEESNNRLIQDKRSLEERRLTREGMAAQRQDAIDLRRQLADQAKANKPAIALPAGVQKAEDEDFANYEAAKTLAQETAGFMNSLAAGRIPVKLGSTMSAKVGGFIGSNSPEVVALNDFERFKTRLVNESLRLNKGTQTEGDAQRSAQELLNARSEADAISAMRNLQRINAEAANRAMSSVERRRVNIGLPRPEMMGEKVNMVPIELPKDKSAANAAYNRLPSGSQYIDPQGNLRTKP